MSANVWFEEVNIGLLKEIKDTIRVKNANGVLVTLEDKALVVRKPEDDFKLETFPCVSIYCKSYKHDPRRYNPAPVKVGEDNVNHQVILEDPATPFILSYQIDFWADYQTDMDMMTRTWLTKHFRQFNLKVVDDGGTERTANCMINGSVVKSDLVKTQFGQSVMNSNRLFHTIINYEIWVELDNETRYNKPMVITRDIDARETQ